jgi:hypothetical protein
MDQNTNWAFFSFFLRCDVDEGEVDNYEILKSRTTEYRHIIHQLLPPSFAFSAFQLCAR